MPMVSNILAGFLFGMTLQLGLGPVNIATWIFGATEGWVKAFKVSIGVALADLIFIIVGYVINNYVLSKYIVALYLFSGVYLIYLGVRALLSESRDNSEVLFREPYTVSGFVVNMGNPKAAVLWVSILAATPQNPAFVLAIPLSTIVWLSSVPIILSIFSIDRVLDKLKNKSNIIIGVVLISYGILTLTMLFSNM